MSIIVWYLQPDYAYYMWTLDNSITLRLILVDYVTHSTNHINIIIHFCTCACKILMFFVFTPLCYLSRKIIWKYSCSNKHYDRNLKLLIPKSEMNGINSNFWNHVSFILYAIKFLKHSHVRKVMFLSIVSKDFFIDLNKNYMYISMKLCLHVFYTLNIISWYIRLHYLFRNKN